MKQRKRYTPEAMANAIMAVNEGASRIAAAKAFGVPERTLRRKIKEVYAGREAQLPGPRPALNYDAEVDLRDWVVVPPLFVLPGKRLDRTILADSNILVPGVKITTADAGFVTANIFCQWLRHFALSVPTPIRRPLMLVLDGVSSHMCPEIDAAAATYGVLLVQLPPISSHLFQPLDVGVFKAVKASMRDEIELLMLRTGHTSLTKKEAIDIASGVWHKSADKMSRNAVSVFRQCGIWPLSLPRMFERLGLFQGNGANTQEPPAAWLRAREVVRTEVLLLPPPTATTRKRRTSVDVNRRLLSADDLESAP